MEDCIHFWIQCGRSVYCGRCGRPLPPMAGAAEGEGIESAADALEEAHETAHDAEDKVEEELEKPAEPVEAEQSDFGKALDEESEARSEREDAHMNLLVEIGHSLKRIEEKLGEATPAAAEHAPTEVTEPVVKEIEPEPEPATEPVAPEPKKEETHESSRKRGLHFGHR